MPETDDQRNSRLEAEFKSRPDAAAKTAEFNLQYGDIPIKPSDLKSAGEIELDPWNAKKKAEYEAKQAGAQPADGQKGETGEVSPEDPELVRDAQAAAAELHGRYGAEAPAVIARAQAVAEHFRSKGPEWEALAMKYIKRHGQAAAVELLSEIDIENE